LMIAARRGIVAGAVSLGEGRWERPQGHQLAGSTLGVVGWGATGRLVGEYARAIGMSVIVHSRRAGRDGIDGFETVQLDELFQRCDVVSLHVELSPATTGIVTAAHLRSLGPRGLIVNTARAPLVDHDVLLAALDSGELGAAALDVFYEEPPRPADRLIA